MNGGIVELTPDEISRCVDFSEKSAKTQQKIEFGERRTTERRTAEIARDNMIGKMAEVAFAKIMETYGVKVDLDFNIYPRGSWDDQDALINKWRIDIKGSREGARWLLIDWNKLAFRQKDNNLSHAYIMFTVGWDRNSDKPMGWVRFEGVASLQKLRAGCSTTHILNRGDFIPGTKMRLMADNFGIRFSDLSKNLDGFVEYILKNEPPSKLTEDFRLPNITR